MTVKLKMDVAAVTAEDRVVLKARPPAVDDPAFGSKGGVIDTIMTLYPLSEEALKEFPLGGIVAVSLELAYDPRA